MGRAESIRHADESPTKLETAHEAETAIESALQAIELAERLDNTEILCDGSKALGITRLIIGDPAGWADLHRGLQLALAARSQEHIASVYNDLAAMAVSRREYERGMCHVPAGETKLAPVRYRRRT